MEVNSISEMTLLEGSPAGRPTNAEGQQPEGVLVLNERDERALAWLIQEAGFSAVQEACGQLAGRRKPYPSNIAKILGLSIPEAVVLTPAASSLERIRDLRRAFPGIFG